jgi:restriction endonuclease S subunit
MKWKVVNLGELVDEFSFRPNDLDIDASSLKFYGVSNIAGIIPTKNAAEDKAEKYKILEKDCFAYNPYRINVGSIALLEEDKKGLISPAYVVFKPKPKSIIPQLLLMFLKSPAGLGQIKIHARGTVRQALRFADLCKIELSLPDFDEQLEFFKKIKETENTSKKLDIEFTHQLELVEKLRQEFLKEAIQGDLISQNPKDESASALFEKIKTEKIRLINEKIIRKQKALPPITEDEISFEIPKNWKWCRLGDVAISIFDGPFGSHLKTADYTNEGIRVIRLENLGVMQFNHDKETFVNHEKYQTIKSHEVYAGDVIIGSFLADGVKCTVLPELKDKAIAKADCFTIRLNNQLLSNKYIMYLLSSSPMFKELFSLLRGMTRLRINTTQLKTLPIPLPSLDEQNRIVTKLDELILYCKNLEESIVSSQKQNKLLVQQVLAEGLGLNIQQEQPKNEVKKNTSKAAKFDPNTTFMEILELLKIHGKLRAEELWKMSKYPDDIDAFYAELKKQIELNNTVKESSEKGYLELV